MTVDSGQVQVYKTSGYHTGLCIFSISDASLAYMRSFSIERGCADRAGFYTDLAVSYKLDSFRKLNPGIQEESLEFPLLKGRPSQVKYHKAVFSAAEGKYRQAGFDIRFWE